MFLTPINTGIRLASGASSVGAAFPAGSVVNTVQRFRVSASVAAHIRIGAGAQTAVNTDLMVVPGESLYLSIPPGITHIAVIQASAAGIVQISPLD